MLIVYFLILICGKYTAQSITGSTCTLINHTMYLLGGTGNESANKLLWGKLFTLDLSEKFDIQDFSFDGRGVLKIISLDETLGKDSTSVFKSPTFGSVFGTQDNKLWFFGDRTFTKSNNILKYYDLKTGSLKVHNTKEAPKNRYGFAYVSYEESFYMFGGAITVEENLQSPQLTNELWKFDLTSLEWTQLPSLTLIKGLKYTSGVYWNGKIVIFGGKNNSGVQDLSKVYLFDLSSNIWTSLQTKGENKLPIVKFRPVIYKDKIYIQGGSNDVDPNSKNYTIYSTLLQLDTSTWTWNKILVKTSSGDKVNNDQLARTGYSGWLIGNQYVQFLGEIKQSTTLIQIINLDTNTLEQQYFPPSNQFLDGNKNKESTSLSTGAIIGIVIGCIVIIGMILIFVYFWKRRSKNENYQPNTISRNNSILKPISPILEPIWVENNGMEVKQSSTTPYSSTQTNSHSNSENTTKRSNQLIQTDVNGSSTQFNSISHPDSWNSSKAKPKEDPLFEIGVKTMSPEDKEYSHFINERFLE